MKSSKKTKNDFLAMWCSEGLECILDLSRWTKEHEDWEKKEVIAILKEEKFRDIEPTIPLQHMILRARVNSQRVYEIYTFTADTGISKEDIEELFETNPQYIVDFIRKNGYKVYSDYTGEKRKVIA